MQVTTVVFLGTPPPVGLGLGPISIAAMYATPIVRFAPGNKMQTDLHSLHRYPSLLESLPVTSPTSGSRTLVLEGTKASLKRKVAYGNIAIFHRLFKEFIFDRACYIAVPLFVCGFLVIGAAFQEHLSLGAVIMGWGIAELSIMINTVAVYAYLNDAFPRHQGEISALIDLARTLGGKPVYHISFIFLTRKKGFAVPYFQVPWATKKGALETYGVEAA